ncbi:hypothetical protein GCM10009557_05510 [Virgisporangium ochraceum]|uniref:Uncharacterized protein n=1 Tax=Virgisporangium ochraceum TaxID=65505 RepID=A0A8J4EFD6_9ACTN|nr:hypothetical protein [Virgisporangium ochraceum]GIJ69972.1 hypothetical protein Voc01_048890 [Virgisporangium ochraceum]
MTDRKGVDCSPWCHVNHERGSAVDMTCSGEVLWHNDSAAVEIARYGEDDFVVLSAFSDNAEPVGANLTLDEAQDLRDALDSALASKRAA